MATSQRPPERGDLIQVDWVDIAEDSTGDPDEAALSRRRSYGVFLEEKDDDGVSCIITTTTVDEDQKTAMEGWCIYPKACIKKLSVVKRHRKSRKKA